MYLICAKQNQIAILLILVAAVHQASCIARFERVLLTNPDALCLDGTQGAYYVYDGKFKNKWIVSFGGGGWCGSSIGQTQTYEDCFIRSKSNLGSSSMYPSTSQLADGILSDNVMNQYQDWSKAILAYCTGTGHQGYKATPISYKGVNLYFRGHTVTVAQLDSLDAAYQVFGSNTTDIIVHGESAGGLAAYLWTNYIKDKASLSTRVISLPDAGIFVDFKHYVTGRNEYRLLIQNFMSIANAQIGTPAAECNAAYPTDLWKCMLAEYVIPYVKVPLFVIQSPYDTWCINNILGIKCIWKSSLISCNLDEWNSIEQYQKKTKSIVKGITNYNPKHGYWVPSCSFHGSSIFNVSYSTKYRIPHGSQNSIMKGILEWESQSAVSYKHMDDNSWPSNPPCSGMQNQEINFTVFGLVLVIIMLLLKGAHSYLTNMKNKLFYKSYESEGTDLSINA